MLKIYEVRNYVSVDGADWRQVVWSWFGPTECMATSEDVDTKHKLCEASFDEAYEHLQNSPLDGLYIDKTFWRERPIINIRYQDAREIVSYKHFEAISYKIEFKEWTTVSLDWIISTLPVDQTIQYLKERGITTCPMNF